MRKFIVTVIVAILFVLLVKFVLYEKYAGFIDELRDNIATVENDQSGVENLLEELDAEIPSEVLDTLNTYVQDGELTFSEIEELKRDFDGAIDTKQLKRILDIVQLELQK